MSDRAGGAIHYGLTISKTAPWWQMAVIHIALTSLTMLFIRIFRNICTYIQKSRSIIRTENYLEPWLCVIIPWGKVRNIKSISSLMSDLGLLKSSPTFNVVCRRDILQHVVQKNEFTQKTTCLLPFCVKLELSWLNWSELPLPFTVSRSGIHDQSSMLTDYHIQISPNCFSPW